MKINVNRNVQTIEGKDFEPPVTLRAALYNACVADVKGNPELRTQGDERLSLDQKLKWHALATRLTSEGKEDGLVELSAREISDIMERVGRIYSIQFIGQIHSMVEPKDA